MSKNIKNSEKSLEDQHYVHKTDRRRDEREHTKHKVDTEEDDLKRKRYSPSPPVSRKRSNFQRDKQAFYDHRNNEKYFDKWSGGQHKSKWDSPEEARKHAGSSNRKNRITEYHDREREPRSHDRRNDRREGQDRRNDRSRSRSNKDRETRHRSHSRNRRRSRSRSVDSEKKFSNKHVESKRHNPRNRPSGSYRRWKEERSYEWGKDEDAKQSRESKESDEKGKPNFALSGLLAEDTNKVNGVVVKYSEPVEARKPKRRWRLYPFKGETALPTLHIHRQSCFLIGRDRKVVDLAVDHPSCSKQHAALQYRLVPFERDDGTQGKRVRLYLIDLDSANGTFINNKPIEQRKYYELLEKDVIKFGFSTREYVLLHENSKEDQEDDDVEIKQEPED